MTTEDILRLTMGVLEQIRRLLPALTGDDALKVAAVLDTFDRQMAGDKPTSEAEAIRRLKEAVENLRAENQRLLDLLLRGKEKQEKEEWDNKWRQPPVITPWKKWSSAVENPDIPTYPKDSGDKTHVIGLNRDGTFSR